MPEHLDPQINELSKKILAAAIDVLGNKLDKVILYGSYARGDCDKDSDIDFFILADVPQNEAGKWRSNIRDRISGIDMEYNLLVSLHVTGCEVFYRFVDILPYYANVIKDGVRLYDSK